MTIRVREPWYKRLLPRTNSDNLKKFEKYREGKKRKEKKAFKVSHEKERENTIRAIIIGTAIGLPIFLGLSVGGCIYSHYNSLEYKRKKGLGRKCEYILPRKGEENVYSINGNKVEVYHYNK